jgi:hypothetical protein
MNPTMVTVENAPALVVEQWSQLLLSKLLAEVEAAQGTLSDEQLVGLYVLSGGNAGMIDAALELAWKESSRITLQTAVSHWFALVKPSRPTARRPYVCTNNPPYCSCGRAESLLCKHLLAAALVMAAGEHASEASWVRHRNDKSWKEAFIIALGQIENEPSEGCHQKRQSLDEKTFHTL